MELWLCCQDFNSCTEANVQLNTKSDTYVSVNQILLQCFFCMLIMIMQSLLF